MQGRLTSGEFMLGRIQGMYRQVGGGGGGGHLKGPGGGGGFHIATHRILLQWS